MDKEGEVTFGSFQVSGSEARTALSLSSLGVLENNGCIRFFCMSRLYRQFQANSYRKPRKLSKE